MQSSNDSLSTFPDNLVITEEQNGHNGKNRDSQCFRNVCFIPPSTIVSLRNRFSLKTDMEVQQGTISWGIMYKVTGGTLFSLMKINNMSLTKGHFLCILDLLSVFLSSGIDPVIRIFTKMSLCFPYLYLTDNF